MSERFFVVDPLDDEGDLRSRWLLVGTCAPFSWQGRYVSFRSMQRLPIRPLDFDAPLDAATTIQTHVYSVWTALDVAYNRTLVYVALRPGQSPNALPGYKPAGWDNLWHPDDGWPEGIAQILPALDDKVLERMAGEPRFRDHVMRTIAENPESAIMSFGRAALGGYLTVSHPGARVGRWGAI